MTLLSLPILPHDATKALLAKLPSRRMRDVVEKRFGLKGARAHTLEAIGQEYKITRERVRQIEADALRHFAKPEFTAEVEPVLRALEEHLDYHGGVMAEKHFLETAADRRHHPHLVFLLEVGNPFQRFSETDEYNVRWATRPEAALQTESILEEVVNDLERKKEPVSRKELEGMVSSHSQKITGASPTPHMIEAHLATSHLIQRNPYNEYGLASWYTISPRGIKDKAYLVLAKARRPLHFRDVAGEINKAGWNSRKAHPQTVHNELIKDLRFVLVGRGLYALREWGYEPGVVRDVLVSVLRQAGHPLAKNEIVEKVLEKRFVKEPTILLNLQNKSLFRRTQEGRYTLA